MTKHEMDSTQTSSEMWYALLMPGYVCAAIEEQHVMHRQEKERMATMSLLLALRAEAGWEVVLENRVRTASA